MNIHRIDLQTCNKSFIIHSSLIYNAERRNKMNREPISRKLRYAILKRDDFRCQSCGRGPKEGVQLALDHKISLADGGTNDSSNLQTFCRECNLGKGKDSDDTPSEPVEGDFLVRKRSDPDHQTKT